MTHRPPVVAVLGVVVGLGCAGAPARPGLSAVAQPGAAICDWKRDHAAIWAMAGEHQVSFAFEETAPLAKGYEAHKPYHADATEMVIVVQDSPRRVSLQHILLIKQSDKRSGMKHWRQDWTFEDQEVTEYKGSDRWEKRRLSPDEARCGWTQAVFDINDGPRYEGWGRWTHAGGISTWTSNETWRPLPRREHTTRSDYDVIAATNRHIVTPLGWIHEQENTKLVLRGEPRALAREHGVNRYDRTAAHDFGAVRDEWRKTEGFWMDARAAWQRILDSADQVAYREVAGGKGLGQELAGLMGEPPVAAKADANRRSVRIEEAIRRHLAIGTPSPTPSRERAIAR